MTHFSCRACGSRSLASFIDLGIAPLSNSMVPFDKVDSDEICYPLHVFVCEDCFLVQLGEFESPAAIFSDDYVYFSSFSETWVEHARRYAEAMIARFSLEPDAHVAEIASNDGYLLQWFAKAGFRVTGVEPAGDCAAAARQRGVTTIGAFFGEATAREIAAERGRADLIAANNVLAHVPDLKDFLKGFREFLKPQGVATFEFPHLLNLIAEKQFDTIYHEHFSYLALRPVMRVLEGLGLRVFDVEEWETHGGSLRIFVCHEAAAHARTAAVDALLAKEDAAGLSDLATYGGFAEEVRRIKDTLLEFLIAARREGKRVAAYGAAAKGSTLLNYCGIGPEYIRYVVDRNPKKQYRFMPGVRIPVYPVERLIEEDADYVLILPWNLGREIAAQLRAANLKAQLVVAVPELEILP